MLLLAVAAGYGFRVFDRGLDEWEANLVDGLLTGSTFVLVRVPGAYAQEGLTSASLSYQLSANVRITSTTLSRSVGVGTTGVIAVSFAGSCQLDATDAPVCR